MDLPSLPTAHRGDGYVFGHNRHYWVSQCFYTVAKRSPADQVFSEKEKGNFGWNTMGSGWWCCPGQRVSRVSQEGRRQQTGDRVVCKIFIRWVSLFHKHGIYQL